MAGGIIALIYVGWLGPIPEKMLKRISFSTSIGLLAASCTLDFLQYIRPYAGALVLGASIYNLNPRAEKLLVNRVSRYIAETSYALYVFHGMMVPTWLGSGETLIKYMKRPLLIMATFVFAHISTFYFEKPINRFVRNLDRRRAGLDVG
jgi:peptidoglycan/LPS O-acetylase OafA/YrhL